MSNENVAAALEEALRFAQGADTVARVTQYDRLPPRPWNWVTADSPSGNGAFHIYLTDANGRKIAALWGKGDEKQAMAEHIVAMANGEINVSAA